MLQANTMKKSLTYKNYKATSKPYPTTSIDGYKKLLVAEKNNIYNGSTGIYLAREIEWGSQKLYFLFIDVDGDPSLKGIEKFQSAITNTTLTYRILKNLNAAEYFTIIATGGEGFRFISNKLVNKPAYQAFVDFIKAEMPHINDTGPSEDKGMPHQIFTYKGHRNHSNKDLVDRHSVVVPAELFKSNSFTVNDYFSLTKGRLDPDVVIEFMCQFLKFEAIPDLTSLNGLGDKLIQYQKVLGEIKINPFNYLRFRKSLDNPISLETMHEMLKEHGIHCVIANRKKMAISFQGLRCPACNSIRGNAVAYPPYFNLKCFNTACPADIDKGGLPLSKWTNIKGNQDHQTQKPVSPIIQLPSQFQTIEDARKIIHAELKTKDNSIIVITPGVGKSRAGLEYLVNDMVGKKVIYSCFNKDLQKEAYNQIRKLCPDHDRFSLIESRETLCPKKDELKEITAKGFSPAEILCSGCEYRKTSCTYYDQFENMNHDVFFTTHHMLQYSEKRIKDPDLIIMDENLKSGLLLEDTCSERQMRTLSMILTDLDYLLITTLFDLGHKIGDQIFKENAYPMIINGRKLAGTDQTEDSLIELLAKYSDREEQQIKKQFENIVTAIDQISDTKLYYKGVDLNAVDWVKGLLKDNIYSYLLITKNGDLFFNYKYITHLAYRNTPMKILDGTGNGKVANALTGRKIKTINADVEWKSYRTHIIVNTSRPSVRRSTDKDLKRLITEILNETTAEKIMVYTYQFIEKRVLDICSQIDNTRTYMGYHFFGPRGINTFKECDAVFVIGLPFANINSAGQDAFILFPDKKDEEIRNNWVEINMEWELNQGIHRIRPVNKDSVDIIVAAKFWPQLLPAPNTRIDKSQSKNKETAAIAALEPFVREFGFLNQDIGFMANVFVKSKASVAKEFQRKLIHVLRANNLDKVNDVTSQLYLGEKDISIGDTYKGNDPDCKKGQLEDHKPKERLISVLYNLYYNNLPCAKNNLPARISKCLDQSLCNREYISPIIFSNTNQWADVLKHFKKKYKHFQNFSIKLPHAWGNFVNGVGSKDQVLDFYKQINSYKIFRTTNLGSYTAEDTVGENIDPIPDKFVVVYVPVDARGLIYIGAGTSVFPISLKYDADWVEDFICRVYLGGRQIITNNGKALAKKIIVIGDAAYEKVKIIDVVLNEKIIRNGEVHLSSITEKSIFKQYGLEESPDLVLTLYQLSKVWPKQKALKKKLGLGNIFELESRLLWVTARIESVGMEIDPVAMLEYQEELSKQGSEGKEYKDIDRYINFANGGDCRVCDEIQQLATKTGRFNRELHRVKKTGPMRSFFIAPAEYKLIRADYSAFEVRIIAGLAGEQNLIDIFESGKDIYEEVARVIFKGSSLKPSELRAIAKIIVVGINNGMAQYSIHEVLTQNGLLVSLQDVQGFVDTYMRSFPDLFKWREKTVIESRNNGYVATRMGRRMVVTNSTESNSIVNFPVQGTGSDGFKFALLLLDGELQGMDARIVHILHDEIIVEANEEIADKVEGIVKNCMEKAFEDLKLEVRMLVEPVEGDAWG
jgi:DNA polymerase I